MQRKCDQNHFVFFPRKIGGVSKHNFQLPRPKDISIFLLDETKIKHSMNNIKFTDKCCANEILFRREDKSFPRLSKAIAKYS